MKALTKFLISLATVFALTALTSAAQSVRTVAKDGTIIINTTEIGEEFIGHHATTPVEIKVFKGKITDITALPSDETPEFFERALEVLKAFIGKTVKEASEAEVDAVTGSTMSSVALIKNVKEGLKYVDGKPKE